MRTTVVNLRLLLVLFVLPVFLGGQTVSDAWNEQPGLAPGAWVNLTGTNLTASPVSWSPRAGKPLPTTLGGVTVTVNGAPAAVAYVSPSRIQFLVPEGTKPGDAAIAVSPGNISLTATVSDALPALYAAAENAASGKRFQVLAAPAGAGSGLGLVTDRGWLLGKPGSDPRVQRGAAPGEEIELFATGLGRTEPEFPTDRLFVELFSVDDAVTVSFGDISVEAAAADLVQPGVYRIRVTVPEDLAPGEIRLTLEIGGMKSTAPAYLLVAADPGA